MLNEPKRDCFAYRIDCGNESCDCLKELYCKFEECRFYKKGPVTAFDAHNDGSQRCMINIKRLTELKDASGCKSWGTIAELCGIGVRAIRRLLHTRRTTRKTVAKLAEYFDVPPEQIISRR